MSKVFLEMFLFGENKSEGGLCTILLMNYGFCLSNCVAELILGLVLMGSWDLDRLCYVIYAMQCLVM